MPPHRLVAGRLTSAVPVRIRALLPARPPCMPCATGLHAILAAVLAIPSSRLKNCDKAARVAQECFSSRQPVDHLGRRRRPSRASCHLTDASNRSMQLPHGQPCPHDSGQQQQARAREQRRPSLRLRLERALKRPVRRFKSRFRRFVVLSGVFSLKGLSGLSRRGRRRARARSSRRRSPGPRVGSLCQCQSGCSSRRGLEVNRSNLTRLPGGSE